MNVPAVHGHVMKRPNVVVNRDSDTPNHSYRGEESERSQKETLAPRVSELAPINIAQLGSRNKQ